MGYFELPARRFFVVTRIVVGSSFTDKLRPLAQYILLIILSAVHLANQYRNIENKGIAYASFIGSILVNLKNIAFAEDRASALHAAVQVWHAKKQKAITPFGYRSLGLLSSIIKIPIRLERLTTGALAYIVFPALLAGCAEWSLIMKIPALVLLVPFQVFTAMNDYAT